MKGLSSTRSVSLLPFPLFVHLNFSLTFVLLASKCLYPFTKDFVDTKINDFFKSLFESGFTLAAACLVAIGPAGSYVCLAARNVSFADPQDALPKPVSQALIAQKESPSVPAVRQIVFGAGGAWWMTLDDATVQFDFRGGYSELARLLDSGEVLPTDVTVSCS